MIKKSWFKNSPLIFLAAAIALSPSFPFGVLQGGKIIEIRAEDFLIVILGLVWIANLLISGRKKIETPTLFFPILAWLGVGFFSILTNLILGNLEISRGFFYFLKEFEFFFIYFYVFYHLKNAGAVKSIVKLWIFLGAVNVGYVVYQISSGSRRGEYGTAAIGEWGVFPTGSFFLIIFIFLLNIFLYYFLNLNISKYKKGASFILIIGLVAGVIGSASKTNFVAMVFALFLTFLFLFLRKANFRVILIFILAIFFGLASFIFIVKNFPVTERLTSTLSIEGLWENYRVGRLDWVIRPLFKETLESSTPFSPFFGLGIGYVGEAHNQYLRNFVEVGIIGSLIFFILIFAIIKKSWQGFSMGKNWFSVGLSGGLLVATLIMVFSSFATEAFIVVKSSEVYWFFTAMAMATLNLKEKEAKTF